MLQKHKQLKIVVFFLFWPAVATLLPDLPPSLEARKPIRWRAKKTVVVDPGHGGREAGARGPGGVLEKDVTLQVARRIETALDSRFKVTLTRTDDYGLEVIRRTGAANHLKADVFVSIHTGASFRRDARAMSIFYFREHRPASSTAPAAENSRWDRLQLKHVKKSRMLAQTLCKRLQEAFPTRRCQIDAAPLLVLRGADMPSVLVEVGTLTNPEDEKGLLADETLDMLGRTIAGGISDFLRRTAGGAGQ